MNEHTSTRTTYGVVTREQQNHPEDGVYSGHDTAQEAIDHHVESCANMLKILEHARNEGYWDDFHTESERKYAGDAMDIVGVVQRVETIHTVWTRVDVEGDSDV